MCRIMEEVRKEGIEEGLEEGLERGREEAFEEARNQMICALLLSNSEEDLLHDDRFRGLNITPEEIDAAKERMNG